MQKTLIAAAGTALLLLLPVMGQKDKKPSDSPGARNLESSRGEFEKTMKKATRITIKGKINSKEVKKIFTQMRKKQKAAREEYVKQLTELRAKFGTDPAINKIRMALVEQLFNLGKVKQGKAELAMLDPTGLDLKEKMQAIRIMNRFGMSNKAQTMLIGLKIDKLTGHSRSLVVTLLAATGQKDRVLKALKDDLSDIIDAQDMWDQIQYMSKRFLSFGPELTRPLMAILYEDALKRYPDYVKADEMRTRLKGLQLKSGSPALPLFGRDLEGERTSLSGMKGKVVLLYFFGSYDSAFRKGLKQLNLLHETYKPKGFQILGVSLDKPMEEAKRAVKNLEVKWPVLCDGKGWESDYIDRYAVYRAPFSLVIDQQGRVQGINMKGDTLEAKLKELLGLEE
jgi:peroxiredoxin